MIDRKIGIQQRDNVRKVVNSTLPVTELDYTIQFGKRAFPGYIHREIFDNVKKEIFGTSPSTFSSLVVFENMCLLGGKCQIFLVKTQN